MAKDKAKVIKKTTEKLLKMLGVDVEAQVELHDEGANVVLETEDSGILIGYHGETLEALQLVVSLMTAKEIGEFVRASLEVGDYRKNREDAIRQMIADAKERVISEGQSVSIPNLKAWERRFVHMILSDDEQVQTESTGEGRDRILEIHPKN